jgi:choline/glycine/proline betaine transport protein
LPIAMLLLVMSYTLIHSLRKEMPSVPAWTPAQEPQPDQALSRQEGREAPSNLGASPALTATTAY